MKEKKISGFSVGNAYIENGLCLAPMAGVTDRAFRRVCRECGAEYTVSEMVSSKAICFEQLSKKNIPSKTAPLAAVLREELPMAVQIFGSDPEFMARAAKMIETGEYRGSLSDCTPTAIDINMGCPVQKVFGNGEGSALMKDPALAEKIVRAVVDSVSIPVTVKIRTGIDEENKNAAEFAKALEAGGASLICVHGRTRKQMYAPGVDIKTIADVKRAVKIPVVGNGDIYSASDALNMVRNTGCDGIAVGRGAMGNPWIFSEIKAVLAGEDYTYPSIRERLETAFLQAEDEVREKGEDIAVREMRKHISWYMKGMRGAAEARFRINTASSLDEIREIIDGVAESDE